MTDLPHVKRQGTHQLVFTDVATGEEIDGLVGEPTDPVPAKGSTVTFLVEDASVPPSEFPARAHRYYLVEDVIHSYERRKFFSLLYVYVMLKRDRRRR